MYSGTTTYTSNIVRHPLLRSYTEYPIGSFETEDKEQCIDICKPPGQSSVHPLTGETYQEYGKPYCSTTKGSSYCKVPRDIQQFWHRGYSEKFYFGMDIKSCYQILRQVHNINSLIDALLTHQGTAQFVPPQYRPEIPVITAAHYPDMTYERLIYSAWKLSEDVVQKQEIVNQIASVYLKKIQSEWQYDVEHQLQKLTSTKFTDIITHSDMVQLINTYCSSDQYDNVPGTIYFQENAFRLFILYSLEFILREKNGGFIKEIERNNCKIIAIPDLHASISHLLIILEMNGVIKTVESCNSIAETRDSSRNKTIAETRESSRDIFTICNYEGKDKHYQFIYDKRQPYLYIVLMGDMIHGRRDNTNVMDYDNKQIYESDFDEIKVLETLYFIDKKLDIYGEVIKLFGNHELYELKFFEKYKKFITKNALEKTILYPTTIGGIGDLQFVRTSYKNATKTKEYSRTDFFKKGNPGRELLKNRDNQYHVVALINGNIFVHANIPTNYSDSELIESLINDPKDINTLFTEYIEDLSTHEYTEIFEFITKNREMAKLDNRVCIKNKESINLFKTLIKAIYMAHCGQIATIKEVISKDTAVANTYTFKNVMKDGNHMTLSGEMIPLEKNSYDHYGITIGCANDIPIFRMDANMSPAFITKSIELLFPDKDVLKAITRPTCVVIDTDNIPKILKSLAFFEKNNI